MGVDPIIDRARWPAIHAARYFLLNNRGAIAPGYLADFAIVDDLKDFHVVTVYKRGKLGSTHDGIVRGLPPARDPGTVPERSAPTTPSTCRRSLRRRTSADSAACGASSAWCRAQIITERQRATPTGVDLYRKDILKIAVVERHKNTRHIGLGYLKGYGLKSGAVATSVAHDSHNIIVRRHK